MDESIPAATPGHPAAGPARLETIELVTGEEPTHSVIWLHGLGADGHDFVPVVPELGLADGAAVRFVFPHAPMIPVTLNGGMRMRAWYDIRSLNAGRDQDVEGIARATAQVRDLMEREQQRGIPPANQVLAGFSQGGAMAMQVGLRYPQRLAGLICLSGYLLFADRLDTEASEANRDLPVFAAHGEQDAVVPFAAGKASADALRNLGYPLTWRSYAMPHSVCMEEIADIGTWLRGLMQ